MRLIAIWIERMIAILAIACACFGVSQDAISIAFCASALGAVSWTHANHLERSP